MHEELRPNTRKGTCLGFPLFPTLLPWKTNTSVTDEETEVRMRRREYRRSLCGRECRGTGTCDLPSTSGTSATAGRRTDRWRGAPNHVAGCLCQTSQHPDNINDRQMARSSQPRSRLSLPDITASRQH